MLYVNLDVAVLGPSAVDATVAQLSKLLAERTTNYVVFMIAPEAAVSTQVYVDSMAESETEMARISRALRQETPAPNTTAPPSPAKYDTYFIPAVNMAIISSVLLLIILTVACACTPVNCF